MSEVKIISALIKIQSEVTNIAKDTQGFGYKYAKLDSVLDMLRPIFNKHGVLIWQDVSSEDGEMVRITTSFIHESGEKKEQVLSYPIPSLAKMNSMQNLGSAISYLRRYCLMTMIGIAGTEDDDGKSGGDYIDSHKTFKKPPKVKHHQYSEKVENHNNGYAAVPYSQDNIDDRKRESNISALNNLLIMYASNEKVKEFIDKSLAFYNCENTSKLSFQQSQKIIERIGQIVNEL